MTDTGTKEAAKDFGPGGLKCYCCGEKKGCRERKKMARTARNREKKRDIKERIEEENND